MNTDDSFKSLKELCCASDCSCLLPTLASHGWCSINKIRTAGPVTVSTALKKDMAPACWLLLCSLVFVSNTGSPNEEWVRILEEHKKPDKRDTATMTQNRKRPPPARSSMNTDKRRDFPLISTTPDHSKGLLSIALAVGSSTESRNAALNELSRDEYGNSSRGPRDARWDTWTKIANSWDCDPLPLDVELCQKIAASMKKAGYKSASLYFNTAQQQHILAGFPALEPRVRLCIKNSLRSIARGLGGSEQKMGFALENITTGLGPNPPDWWPELKTLDHAHWRMNTDDDENSMQDWTPARSSDCTAIAPITMCILGCWFLTREIELSAAKMSDDDRHSQQDGHMVSACFKNRYEGSRGGENTRVRLRRTPEPSMPISQHVLPYGMDEDHLQDNRRSRRTTTKYDSSISYQRRGDTEQDRGDRSHQTHSKEMRSLPDIQEDRDSRGRGTRGRYSTQI